MNNIAKLLFQKHKHAESVSEQNPDQIVYKEADVIDILKFLGHEEPDFEYHKGEDMTPVPIAQPELPTPIVTVEYDSGMEMINAIETISELLKPFGMKITILPDECIGCEQFFIDKINP